MDLAFPNSSSDRSVIEFVNDADVCNPQIPPAFALNNTAGDPISLFPSTDEHPRLTLECPKLMFEPPELIVERLELTSELSKLAAELLKLIIELLKLNLELAELAVELL